MTHPQTTTTTTPAEPAVAEFTIPPGFLMDGKGNLVKQDNIPEADLLEDQLVDKLFGFAFPLAAQLGRFKGHCYDDIGAFMSLLAEKYGAKPGGRRGNVSFKRFDDCRKVEIAVSDTLEFGPSLQTAKGLVDEYISREAATLSDGIRALVNHAFQVDKAGKINTAALFQLRRIEIKDDIWQRAMEALTASIRIAGSKQYIRFYYRDDARAPWVRLTLDLASA